jgi:hypothetical protein
VVAIDIVEFQVIDTLKLRHSEETDRQGYATFMTNLFGGGRCAYCLL